MNSLLKEIKEAKKIAIAGHIRPDGDCVGSCMAVYGYIKNNIKNADVTVYLESVSEVFHFLEGTKDIVSDCQENCMYDLFITLDASDLDRIGPFSKYFESAERTLCIDHHISNTGFADVNQVIANASSTCEVVYELMDKELITKSIAEALYVGIAHDTGVFQYSCTSPRTMEIAGDLMSRGIPFTEIVDNTFYKKTYVQNQILGRALLESILLLDGKIIFTVVKKSDMEFYNVGPKDLEGIVNQIRVTKGVEAALFLYETDNHEYKVSMRSNGKINVSEIASYFGGGGHVMAAGCTMAGRIHDVINNLTLHIEKQLDETKEE